MKQVIDWFEIPVSDMSRFADWRLFPTAEAVSGTDQAYCFRLCVA